ncbi:MAG: DUF3795 domain-containing protein [Desulfobacula sp.]|jgi:hypothetical protein|nr:DUF3795 domain-containing protein [Desulfobacula sp.]
MNSKNETAYCGIYCQDCMHFKNKYSVYAQKLFDELKELEFDKYAEINSGFRANFKDYSIFSDILKSLADIKCNNSCRVGGGCSGNPCKIMECCVSRGYEGCWECTELEECNKFKILETLCGEMPKNNVRKIKEHGIQNWVNLRDKFYIWQKSNKYND